MNSAKDSGTLADLMHRHASDLDAGELNALAVLTEKYRRQDAISRFWRNGVTIGSKRYAKIKAPIDIVDTSRWNW